MAMSLVPFVAKEWCRPKGMETRTNCTMSSIYDMGPDGVQRNATQPAAIDRLKVCVANTRAHNTL